MKITKELNQEQLVARLKELSGALKEDTGIETSKLLYQVKGPDFNRYGILNEGQSFYIKASSIQSKEILTESDFTYIGGLANKTSYKYSSYSDALKNLNMMFKQDLTEGYYHSYSIDKETPLDEVEQEYQEQPAPEQEYQQAPADNAPAPQPETQPQGDYDPELEGPDSNDDENIDHYVGKLTNLIRNTPEEELSHMRIKSILNSVISSLPLDRVAPEDRLELAKRVKDGKDDENSDGEDSQPAPADNAPAPQPETEPAPEQQPQGGEEELDLKNLQESINKITSDVLKNLLKL